MINVGDMVKAKRPIGGDGIPITTTVCTRGVVEIFRHNAVSKRLPNLERPPRFLFGTVASAPGPSGDCVVRWDGSNEHRTRTSIINVSLLSPAINEAKRQAKKKARKVADSEHSRK